MQICAHGIDIVDCARIATLLERHPERFVGRVYTPAEQAYAHKGKNGVERLSGRFAAKEAFAKALGSGFRGGLTFRQIEVKNDSNGRPFLDLHGKSNQVCKACNIRKTHLSLSDDGLYAIAMILLEQ